MTATSESRMALLGDLMELLVPMRIREIAGWSESARIRAGRACSDPIAAHGDDLQYGGRHHRDALSALVTGLAVIAYQPGGVDFAGRHWCVDHTACHTAAATAEAVAP